MAASTLPPPIDWLRKEHDPKALVALQQGFDLRLVEAQLLAARGLTEASEVRQFLARDIGGLHDPFLLPQMGEASNRLAQAIRDKETILIHGDYDVDGITATALMARMLGLWKADARTFIPDRFTDGYGLTMAGVEVAKEHSATLLVSVDCGVTAVREVAALNELGIDTIITDHHEHNEELGLPEAVAVVNPIIPGSEYPDGGISGSAVAFKLLEATSQRLGKRFPLEPLLRIVALGTVADVVPLQGESRLIAHHGLERLHETNNIGLQALFRSSRVAGRKLKPGDVGFILGPRLNAAGRMGTANPALQLLLTDKREEAEDLAQLLEDENRDRQQTQDAIFSEAVFLAGKQCDVESQTIIVVANPGWHEGVVGIVASKLREHFSRPCLVVAINEHEAKGSGRSVPGFHLHECVTTCEDLLGRWGGHSQAVGFSMEPENIDTLRQRLNEAATAILAPGDCRPAIIVDADMPLSQVDHQLMNFLERLEPFGQGNPQPTLCARKVHLIGRPNLFGAQRNHLRVRLADEQRSLSLKAVLWRKGQEYASLLEQHDRVDIAFQPYIDTYRGAAELTLRLKDVRPCDDDCS